MKHITLAFLAAATLCTPALAQNKVKNLYTGSNTLNVEMLANTEQTVQVNRYLYAGYNTLCLPMSLSAEQLAAAARDVQVERLGAIRQEGNTLCLIFVDCTAEGIQAGTPYLIYSPTTQYFRARNTDALYINTELKTVRLTDGEGNQVAFGSSWESMQKNGRYGIPAQQDTYPLQSVLVRTEADKIFLPTRCGFTWEKQAAGAQNLIIKHVTDLSEATGIQSLSNSGAIVDVYDLKGNLVRKQVKGTEALRSLPTGVYVVGGEKVIIK